MSEIDADHFRYRALLKAADDEAKRLALIQLLIEERTFKTGFCRNSFTRVTPADQSGAATRSCAGKHFYAAKRHTSARNC
jgi:hypothetical protein